jgi:tetratricopeptide (TPR) repeat protein
MEPTPSTLEPRAKRAWTVIAAWIAGISAVIGFLLTLTGAWGKLQDHFHSHAERDSQMAIAQSQSKQGDYAAAIQSYDNILKANSLYAPALDQQLQTAMLWIEDFHVYMKQGQDDAGPTVASQLDEIIAIFDSALVRVKGTQSADVQAHLGWAHWLNQHLASREFGPAAEKNLRAALATDPNNVYANAMLGNWLLQNGGELNEALVHFRTAVATGKQRPLVRTMQIGGLLSVESRPASAELYRAANDMRRNNEPLDPRSKGIILFQCLGVSFDSQSQLSNSLTAVPPDDAWQTYLWLDDVPRRDEDEARYHDLLHDFISAEILELSGKPADALAKYRTLQLALKGHLYSLSAPVDEAIKRISH